ncbi:MAG TPA: zf-HC2 domain-containing protein [Chloroflexota bacterium]
MACNELVEVITEYLEGELPVPDRLRFEKHLAICPGCRAYVEQMRQTIDALGTLPPTPISEEEKKRVLGLFHDWKQGNSE